MKYSTDKIRLRQNEESRKRYHWYKDHHICVKCGQAEAVPNRTKCDACLEKDRNLHRENWNNVRDVRNIYAKNRRARNKNKGMCAKCGAKPLWGEQHFYVLRLHDCPEKRHKKVEGTERTQVAGSWTLR